MRTLFARIRWRLVGWTMLIVGVILLLLGGVIYFALQRSLMDQVDRTLAQRAEQIIPPLLQPDRRFRGAEGFRGGVFYLAFDADGRLFGNPQQVDAAEAAALPTPEPRTMVFDTIEVNGEPARVAIRHMPDGGKLVVGQTLKPELDALQSLLIVLAVGAGIGLLLSLAGAWFLAGRALIPIQQAFHRQQEFVADASHELRTPLTVLQSSAELLNRHRDEPLSANPELFDDVRDEIARVAAFYTFGGEGNDFDPRGIFEENEVYNPRTDTWMSLEPIPTPVHGVTGAAYVNGWIHLPGGGISRGGNSGSTLHQVFQPVVDCEGG